MKHVQAALALTLGIAATAALATACGGGTSASQPSTSPRLIDDSVAASIEVPEGNKLAGRYEARGVQVYQCPNGEWKPLEPAATLTDNTGKPVMLHSRGPVWVSTIDGSAVEATPVDGATADRPNAIPEILLKAKTTRGEGVLGKVTYVQRLQTEGGLAPAGTCTANTQVSVGYGAIYAFYTAG
jgi:hypothetical protein